MKKSIRSARKKLKGEIRTTKKSRLIEWRKAATVTRIDKPSNPERARSLGYKAKQGFVIARVRVGKGKRKRPKFSGGRVPKKMGRFFPTGKSKRLMGEEKAARKFPNMQVINSYAVGEDGQHAWFEVIMADPKSRNVSKSKESGWISEKQHRGRAFRSLTSAGKKMRGLRK